jgi:antitoxin VapB
MPITLDDDTERLARELAAITGESVEEAVTVAIRERLDRVRASQALNDRIADI